MQQENASHKKLKILKIAVFLYLPNTLSFQLLLAKCQLCTQTTIN